MKSYQSLLSLLTFTAALSLPLSASHHGGGHSEAPAQAWKLDAAHSQVDFRVRHMMVASTRGTFATFDGAFANLETPAKASGSIEIDVASIDTGNEDRDNHLRSADFFDAENHPKINFKISKLETSGENTVRIVGDLTMKGVTKEITFTGEMNGPVQNPWGQTIIGVSVTTELNRTDFGLTWNRAIETGGVVVGETVRISAEFEVIKE